MAENTTFETWETMVQKQLKTDDIYGQLSKENLEGLQVKPFYSSYEKAPRKLPKVEESTHLVSSFSENADENVYAFLLKENAENLDGKTLFIDNKELAAHIVVEDENTYFSLVDVFDEKSAATDELLVKELLEKNFKRKICIDISLHQNAGAAIYQQLGIALAKAKELTEKYGAEILKTLIFRIAIGGNYFFEIAKIRALKIVFNQFSKEFGFNEIPYIFAETSLRNKAKNDEENNLIRSTLELAAAMIGGADAVFTNDYKLENHSELSEEISFKQQIILAYESIINVFEDAAEGSYYIEDLTRQIAEKAWEYFIKIEENGGYLATLKNGNLQREIYDHAIAEQNWVSEGKIKLIGVNLYPKLDEKRTAEELYNPEKIKAVRLSEMFE